MSAYQRRYFDEDTWETIDEATARDALAKTYADVDPVLDELGAGRPIYTSGAEYRTTGEDQEVT